MTYEIAFVTIVSAILAGVSWNTLGVWQRWRNGAEDTKIEWKKVRKNVIIGAVLGIIGYGYQLSQGDTAPVITTVNEFIVAVIGYFPLIVVADKIFNRNKEKSEDEVLGFGDDD